MVSLRAHRTLTYSRKLCAGLPLRIPQRLHIRVLEEIRCALTGR
jgi:hypothetical protein